jgi:hypothetical protein
VFVSGQKRGVTPTIRRERRRRNAIEPSISQLGSDGHLGRNFLRGTEGDAANVILAAAGHNLRLLRTWIAWLLACLLSLLRPDHQTRENRQPRALATWKTRSHGRRGTTLTPLAAETFAAFGAWCTAFLWAGATAALTSVARAISLGASSESRGLLPDSEIGAPLGTAPEATIVRRAGCDDHQ